MVEGFEFLWQQQPGQKAEVTTIYGGEPTPEEWEDAIEWLNGE